ncbi:MAG: aspartate aminotransferase family protein [Gemmatimonadaceae bacterium]|nr:aspartate aminotransferase family protein [Gemmatimonadaceae bacterium]
MSIVDDLERQLSTTYALRTPSSRALHERAQRVMPGGDTRTGTFYPPHPTFMDRGEGPELVDVDGNRYVDFLGNYTSLIHGHAEPRIAAAIAEQARVGTALGYPSEQQVALAEAITERVPSVERLRFCNSGTEAVMQAIRCARASTGRRMIVKVEGSYHGAYDVAQVSVAPGIHAPPYPTGVPEGPGVSTGILAEVLVVPFNDLAMLEWILGRYARDIAAVLVEPVVTMAGLIVPDAGYLEGVVEAAHAVGALVIFDEIVTFRLSIGGVQGILDLAPDLTTLGKVIGGGLSVGAFGGRAEVMALFDPRVAGTISHSGTFNGNNASMAAGLAALANYGPDEVVRLDQLGARMRRGLQREIDDRGVLAHVQGVGSLAHIHYCAGPVRSYRDALRTPRAAVRLTHLGLLVRGYLVAPRNLLAVNTAMTAAEVDGLCAAFGEVLDVGRDVFPRVGVGVEMATP